MTTVHRCMIVPSAQQEFAQQLCAVLAGVSGDGMFVRGLSPTGAPPATHYISSGPVGSDFAALMPLKSFDAQGVASIAPGQPAVIAAMAAQAGIVVTLEQIQALLAAVEVTDEVWQAALERCALKRILTALSGA